MDTHHTDNLDFEIAFLLPVITGSGATDIDIARMVRADILRPILTTDAFLTTLATLEAEQLKEACAIVDGLRRVLDSEFWLAIEPRYVKRPIDFIVESLSSANVPDSSIPSGESVRTEIDENTIGSWLDEPLTKPPAKPANSRSRHIFNADRAIEWRVNNGLPALDGASQAQCEFGEVCRWNLHRENPAATKGMSLDAGDWIAIYKKRKKSDKRRK